MIQANKLKGIIVSKGYSQRKLAIMMGMSPKTFYDKMKKGVFDSDEIMEMMNILDIDNPKEIFFAHDNTQ